MSDSKKPSEDRKVNGVQSSLADQPTVLFETTEDHGGKNAQENNQENKKANDKIHDIGDALTDDLLPGTRINRIVIERLIGKGGMGAVYLAYDEKLHRQVALKSIRPEFLSNPDTQLRFIREARILSKINHQSICHIYDYIEAPRDEAQRNKSKTEGSASGDFLVLEYIKGKQLYKVSLNQAQTLDALIALAEALDVAHAHGVIHRDLKPDNVMISDSGQLKVLDFGIAQSMPGLQSRRNESVKSADEFETASELTQQGSLVGTIRYMSPEQAKGEVLTPASDIYALGVMSQELFGRKPAYAILETKELLRDVQQGRLLECANLTTSQRHLVKQLTASVPEQRPDAKKVVVLLKRIKQAPLIKKRKRFRVILGMAALVVVGLLVWQWQQFSIQKKQAEQFITYKTAIYDLVNSGDQIYALPIHNVKEEIAGLFAQGGLLFQKIETDGLISDGQRKHLHGLIFLESDEFSLAVQMLQESGEASADELANAWLGLYIQKIILYSGEHGYTRFMESDEIRDEYLAPALEYVSKAADESRRKGESVNALHHAFWVAQKQSVTDAVALLDDMITEQKWNNEAVKYKAFLLSTLAVKHKESGEWAKAYDFFLASVSTYSQASEMARSYPYNYSALCLMGLNLMEDALQRTGQNFETHANQTVKACEAFLQTLPGSVGVQNQLSMAYWLTAQWQLSHGQSAQFTIDKAAYWNQISRDNVATNDAQTVLAYIKLSVAIDLSQQGLSAGDNLNQALLIVKAMYKESNQAEGAVAGDVLFVYGQLITDHLRQMKPITGLVADAEQLYATVMSSDQLLAINQRALLANMGYVRLSHLLYELLEGNDISKLGSEYLPFFQKTVTELKHEPNVLINYAFVRMLLASASSGEENKVERKEHVAVAQKMVNQATEINNSSQGVKMAQAMLLNWQAVMQKSGFDEADLAFETAMSINPRWGIGYVFWAEALLVRVKSNQSSNLTEKERQQHIDSALNVLSVGKEIDPLNKAFEKVEQAVLSKMLVVKQKLTEKN